MDLGSPATNIDGPRSGGSNIVRRRPDGLQRSQAVEVTTADNPRGPKHTSKTLPDKKYASGGVRILCRPAAPAHLNPARSLSAQACPRRLVLPLRLEIFGQMRPIYRHSEGSRSADELREH